MNDLAAAVLGVRIKVPPEAVVPILIGCAALTILLLFGAKLADWKARAPASARTFGLVVGAILTAVAIYFLARCLTNQNDPNNDLPGRLEFIDPIVAGFMGALSAAFWRMGDRRSLTLVVGLGLGGVMVAKPFVWPVIRIWEGHADRARGLIDPEHVCFWGPGIVVIATALIAGLAGRRRAPR